MAVALASGSSKRWELQQDLSQTDSPSSPIFIAPGTHYLQDQMFGLGGGEFPAPTVSPQVNLAEDPQNVCIWRQRSSVPAFSL